MPPYFSDELNKLSRLIAYVLSSAALINAISPQHEIILEPPALINGNVTPVSGKISVAPKMLSES